MGSLLVKETSDETQKRVVLKNVLKGHYVSLHASGGGPDFRDFSSKVKQLDNISSPQRIFGRLHIVMKISYYLRRVRPRVCPSVRM
jgi:hypothetical protein